MGNAPSLAELPHDWEEVLPNITREDIIRSSRKKCRVVGQSVYLDDDLFDLDDDNHVPIALAILRGHPHLKDIRFKLVPGRMTEENYWAALFGILHDGGIDIDGVVGTIDDDYETGDEVDDCGEVSGENELSSSAAKQGRKRGNGNKLGRTPIAKLEQAYYDDDCDAFDSNANDDDAPPSYLKQIKAQQAHIARLQKSLREANHKTRKLALELHKERKKVGNAGAEVLGKGEKSNVDSVDRCDATIIRKHKAGWEMHPDCIEFLKLDDHLKENLRKEKEKRMNEVKLQMKFILDTDDIKDSYGKWPCCGKEDYNAEGCEQ